MGLSQNNWHLSPSARILYRHSDQGGCIKFWLNFESAFCLSLIEHQSERIRSLHWIPRIRFVLNQPQVVSLGNLRLRRAKMLWSHLHWKNYMKRIFKPDYDFMMIALNQESFFIGIVRNSRPT
jgi:hypothetical protein